jgi:hypothetical protein
MRFADLIGSEILVLIPKIDPKIYQKVTLRGVEAGGLWLESQDFTNALLQALGAPASEKTPIVFWPYHQIVFAISAVDQPSFDEKAFGL